MCTASWIFEDGGYDLFFNRDEQRTRLAARPPEGVEVEGVRALAPTDGDAGGTWIGVNELGVGLALLNGRDVRRSGNEPFVAARSRGLLVRDLLGSASAEAALARVDGLAVDGYAAFVLMAFEPGRAPRAVAWDGAERVARKPGRPTSSSGLDPDGVQHARRRVLEDLSATRALTVPLLEEFHASHRPERGLLSPCMHEARVRTVSSTHLGVRAGHVFLRYGDGPPCRVPLGDPLELARRGAEPA